MDREIVKVGLTVAHTECENCGFKRIVYYMSGFMYGQDIVCTKSGKDCAYVNLLNESIIDELKEYCLGLLSDTRIAKDPSQLAGILHTIYGITCDDINGEKVDTTPNEKCPVCITGDMVEDQEFEEQMQVIEMPYVSHDAWNRLDKLEREDKVRKELIRQGYLEE